MSVKSIRDTQIMTFDTVLQRWRKIVKGELSGSPTIVSKAADYTIPASVYSGSVFISTAAMTWTLPDPAKCAGAFLTFINAADANMTIAPPTADTLITFNDATADSIAYSTAGNKIGARAELWSDGTNWYAFSACQHTVTVAT